MKLEKIIHELLKKEPFYAQFTLNCEVRYNTNNVPTAGAMVQNGRPVLIFNTTFMDTLSLPSQIAILKHEILHLLFDHTDFEYYDKLNIQVWNAAMDCAINQYIPNLPEMAITLDAFSKLCKKPLEAYQSAVYYYNELLPNCETVEIPAPMDSHSIEGQSELDKKIGKGVVARAADDAVKSAAGNVPEGLSKVMERLRTGQTINWKQQLRNFVASAISSKIKHTRKKSHRRFELDQPGKKKKRELKLAICVDSSGSVSDEQFGLFIAEIAHITKNCAEANLIYADCEVHKVVNLKTNDKPPMERYGNGGTAYQPAITKAVQLQSNVIIYFGDLDCADTPVDPKIPMLWVTCGSEVRPGEFGRVLKLGK
jgi:predicted metal-dependent peptidase